MCAYMTTYTYSIIKILPDQHSRESPYSPGDQELPNSSDHTDHTMDLQK